MFMEPAFRTEKRRHDWWNLTPSTTRQYGLGSQTIGTDGAFTWISDVLVLTKARVNSLVVGTTFFGFALHAEILPNWLLLLHTLLGTGLGACGAAVENQVLEDEHDRKVLRTQKRPLVVGRMSRRAAAWFSATLCFVGCVWLGIVVSFGTMLLAGLAFLIYAFLYTPLKRRTPACTLMGAVAGALPFAVGWAATSADFGVWTFSGLAILFLWQIPHVHAITWRRRTEYARAGFRMLSQSDVHGKAAAGWALVSALAVVGVSLLPAWLHNVSFWYTPASLALGIPFIGLSLRLVSRRSELTAKALFIASLYYLPSLYSLTLIAQQG